MRRNTWKQYGPTLGALVLLALVPGIALAEDGPEPEAAEVPRSVSLELGIDFPTQYYFRGIVQETDHLIAQPWTDAGFTLHESDGALSSVSLGLGMWHSLHGGPTGSQGMTADPEVWYEADIYSSLSVGLWSSLSIAIGYTLYTSPNGSFPSVGELSTSLAFEDAAFWPDGAQDWFGGINPSLTLAAETHGQADGGANEGVYLQLGIEPQVTIFETESVTLGAALPVSVGMSLSDYYEDADGDDSALGFVDAGISMSVGLGFISPRFGSWELGAGANVVVLGETTRQMNDSRRAELIGRGGLSGSF